MTTERISNIWGLLALLVCIIYPISVAITFEHMINNSLKGLGVSWIENLNEFTIWFTILIALVPVILVYYAYQNPQIIFSHSSDQKRLLMTKRFWDGIKNYPEEKLDSVAVAIPALLHNIQYKEEKKGVNP